MKDDSPLQQPVESAHTSELVRGAAQPRRHRFGRIITIFSGVLAVLFVATIAFRVINPISPVGVAETFGAPNIKSVWLPLQKISPDLPLAVIASEDGRFCNHWGVDWPAVREAINEGGGIRAGLRGASTIPMQLAKNLYLWPERSYLRKTLELPLAFLISALWPKKVVMETYLNIAPWGPVVGAEAASRHYFKKSATELTRQEAILLAVALPSPSARNPANPTLRMKKIAQAVEGRMPTLASRSKCVWLDDNILEGPASWP